MKLNVYLSGSVLHSDDTFQNWRERCNRLQEHDTSLSINFIDPIKYFNYTDKNPQTDKQCLDLFMYLVDKSDILLLNLDNSKNSCGAMMELEHAYCKGIPIIAFGKDSDTWYNWAELRASVVLRDLYEAISYIDSYYAKSILD